MVLVGIPLALALAVVVALALWSRGAPAFVVPVYFMHGRYDHTVSYVGARSFLAALEAPVKGFYTFEHSAHSPIFEEPERMQRILREDVLSGANALADGR